MIFVAFKYVFELSLVDTTGWMDDKVTLFCFPFLLWIGCFFFLGAEAEPKSNHLQHSDQFANHHFCCWFHQRIYLKKHCQFIPLLYMNHNQNIHNYSLLDFYYFFWGMFSLRKLPFLFYESDVYIWEFVSGKIVFLIHLINGLAYPRCRYRPDVYIWTLNNPVATEFEVIVPEGTIFKRTVVKGSNDQTGHQEYLRKTRHVKLIKSTETYDKW